MIPSQLSAPAPGWSVDTDVVVVGSGIAGLVTALRASAYGRVLLVTKALPDAGSTRWAQGGIAAALAPGDSAEQHLADTLTAGVGLCDPEAVWTMVTEGPAAVRRLIDLGAQFDQAADGGIALTREGGHHRRRIAHAGGDATGAEISRALLAACKEAEIETIQHALVLDLLLDPLLDEVALDGDAPDDPGRWGGPGSLGHPGSSGHAGSLGRLGSPGRRRVAGVTLHVMGEGRRDGVGMIRSRAVVLATGGLGQVYSATTNPEVSTGDGVALALRAGAAVADLEFVQFHPTVLWLGEGARGQQPLISEAVRGEGAYLVDASGDRFMVGRHELAELAPRDVVTKGIMTRMRETGAPHVYLDGRHLGARTWEDRFPTILASCRRHGIDPVNEPIPIVPAAHYASGGVRTDRLGRTSIPGLYACGEVACTGVHGANRLASNSLLEGLVFAERIARTIAAEAVPAPAAQTFAPAARLLDPAVRGEVQRIMTAYCGVLRDAGGLARAEAELAVQAERLSGDPCVEAWEATNLHTVASAIVAAARRREETRGSHWREDFPDRDDARWRGHLATTLDSGHLDTSYEAVSAEPSGFSAEPSGFEPSRLRGA